MRSFSSAFLALAALCAATSNGLAQQQGFQLEPGARVRLISPTLQSDQQIVRILSAGRDTVVFRSERNPVTRSLALNEISAVEVSLGERRRTRRGAVIGLLSGAAIGGIAGYVAYEPCTGFCLTLGSNSAAGDAAIGGAVGGVLGLLVGTTIGWLSKSEKWQRVQLNTRVGVATSRSGSAVSVSHAF